jgi:hypothetical protein
VQKKKVMADQTVSTLTAKGPRVNGPKNDPTKVPSAQSLLTVEIRDESKSLDVLTSDMTLATSKQTITGEVPSLSSTCLYIVFTS